MEMDNEMKREIFEVECVWLFFPPREVFLNSNRVFGEYQGIQKFSLKGWKIILDDEGMFFDNSKDPYLYPGVVCPPIIQSISLYKRAVIGKIKSLKNPFTLLSLKESIRELREIAETSVEKYHLKPHRYSHAIREVYQILDKMFPNRKIVDSASDFVHDICSVLEFDNAYRFSFQAFMGNLDRKLLKTNPKRAIMENIEYTIDEEPNHSKKEHWKEIKWAFKVLWLVSRKFRKLVKQFMKEADMDEIKPNEADIYFQTH